MSSKNAGHSQSYRLPKFLKKMLPHKRDQNNIWRIVVANLQKLKNARASSQRHASNQCTLIERLTVSQLPTLPKIDALIQILTVLRSNFNLLHHYFLRPCVTCKWYGILLIFSHFMPIPAFCTIRFPDILNCLQIVGVRLNYSLRFMVSAKYSQARKQPPSTISSVLWYEVARGYRRGDEHLRQSLQQVDVAWG